MPYAAGPASDQGSFSGEIKHGGHFLLLVFLMDMVLFGEIEGGLVMFVVEKFESGEVIIS